MEIKKQKEISYNFDPPPNNCRLLQAISGGPTWSVLPDLFAFVLPWPSADTLHPTPPIV